MSRSEGHRERLRQKFKQHPHLLSDAERLELLLTYAIPRKDVAPLARGLIAHFGDIHAVLAAAPEQLSEVAGMGESTTTLKPEIAATLPDWIRQCRRAGLFELGRALYEKGGLRFDELNEETQLLVEEDYQICAGRSAKGETGNQQTKSKKRVGQTSLFQEDEL